VINTVKKLLHYARPYHSIIKKNNKRASERASRKDNMTKHKVIIIETNTWSTEVEAETKEQAIKLAEKIHVGDTDINGGRMAYTFEHYTDEGNKLDFK